LLAYRPATRITAPVLLVRADLDGEPDLGWSRLTDRLRVAVMSCDHESLVREPHVLGLAALIEEAISAEPRPAEKFVVAR
jgi:thioesterase domain-containing protein